VFPVIPKRYTILLLGAIASVAAAILVWKLIPEDNPQRVSVRQAVRQFRAEVDAEATGGDTRGPRPEFGVYSYGTSGGEKLDAALVSSGHDYEGVSTVALQPGECGVVERWQILAGRWREEEGCTLNSRENSRSLREVHEFFGTVQRDDYSCAGPATTDPANLEPGRRLVTVCKSASGSVVTRMEVTSAAPLRIDGETLHPVLVEGSSQIRGSSSGEARFADWRRPSDGLLLRREVTSRVSSDDFGGTNYSESYRLRLLSLAPEH
jgi:hypothetical protein